MKNIPLSVLVVTVAVGAVIGAVTSSLLAPSEAPESDGPPPVVVEASGSSDLEAGMRSLRKANDDLADLQSPRLMHHRLYGRLPKASDSILLSPGASGRTSTRSRACAQVASAQRR